MVVEINRRCELIYDLKDVSNIIRKYYNTDIADEMDRLLEENEDYIEGLREEIKVLESRWGVI